MAYTFTTFSPANSSQISCNAIPGRSIQSYWYVTQSDSRVQLVAYNENDTLPPNVKFNVQFGGENGNQGIISFIGENNNTYYFAASGNNVIYTSSSTDASSWYFYSVGSTTPTTNLNYSVLYTQLVGTNNYMINYIKDSSGNFAGNNYLTLDIIPEGQTPYTLQRGNISCNYTFVASPLSTSNYNVVASSSNDQIDDLKFNIKTNGDNFTGTANISRWQNNSTNILSKSTNKSTTDDLLFAIGTKNKFSEFGFTTSYDVKLTIRSKIISRGHKVNNINSIISIFELAEHYIILEVYGNYFLLTNEINPSYNKLKCLQKRFYSFVRSARSVKSHKQYSEDEKHISSSEKKSRW